MPLRKILIGIAAGAVGLGALWFSLKEAMGASPPQSQSWMRSMPIAQSIDHPLGVVVDGNDVYFASGGFVQAENAIRHVKAQGGPVETLTKVDQIVSGELCLDGEYVYFSSDYGNAVLRVPRAGGTATVIARAPAPTYLAVDATHVYFTTFAKREPGGTLQRVPKAGGTAEVLLGGHPGMDGLVVDEHDIYFRSNKGLWKLPKSGGAAQNLWMPSEKSNVDRLAADASHLYFFYKSESGGRYSVARLSKNGGAPETIGPVANSAGYLGLSNSHVYFFREASMTADALAKVPKAGGQAETVDGAGYSTGHLYVAGDNVYFTDLNSVYRVSK